ncbi:MAG: hypothetical protein AAF962_20900 [Actinomycetota bacterium]
MRISVPLPVVIICAVFAAIIPTAVGLISWISPENAPLYVDGSHDVMLSWGARSLGLAAAGWIALLVVRDARGYAAALGAAAVREVLDLIDLLFRSLETSTGLYVMLPISSTSLVTGFALSVLAIRRHQAAHDEAPTPGAAPATA